MTSYGVAPQSIPPIMTLSGADFEQHIEEGVARHAGAAVNCRTAAIANDDEFVGQDHNAVIIASGSVAKRSVCHFCACEQIYYTRILIYASDHGVSMLCCAYTTTRYAAHTVRRLCHSMIAPHDAVRHEKG
ncbi:MAG: hypothetical protein WCI67_17940 [Chloroflexales bacterium]